MRACAAIVSALILSAMITELRAADTGPINDLRFGVSAMLAPRVQEVISSPTGNETSYDWKDTKRFSLRFSAEYLQGMASRGLGRDGFVWGVGGLYGASNVTPGAYRTPAGEFDNTRGDIRLDYKEYGLSFCAGYATAPKPSEVGGLAWELLPVLRTGLATIETTTPGLITTRETGRTPFWEVAMRSGFSVSDNGFILSLYAGWAYGQARFSDIDAGSAGSSDILVVRNSPEIGLTIGGRF